MTITRVGEFGAGSDSGSPAPVLPTGISFGDAIGAFGVTSTAQTLTAPAGWTVKSGWPKDSGNARVYAWVKDSVTASDSGTTATFTSTGSKAIVEGFVVTSGNGFPSDWTDALIWQAHTSGTSYTAPQSTSTAAGDWGVAAFMCRGTDPTAWTPASGLTERQDLQRAGSGATSLQLCDSNGSIGGASTAFGAFSETNISTTGGGGLTWLVKENATGGGGGGGGGGGVAYSVLGLWADRTGVAWELALSAREAIYGPVQGHWGDYYPAGQVPLSSAAVTKINAGKLVHVFWKPQNASGQANDTWADVASGLRDTQLDAAAASIASVAPKVVWLTVHHEPEDDYIAHGSGGAGWTAANYRGMWQRVRDRFNLVPVTNVVWVMVWQNSHSHPAEMITLWGNDSVMDGLVDINSQQDYIAANTDPARIATKWLEDLEWARTNEDTGRHWGYLSKPQAFTEWGADHGGVTRGTNVHRADTIDAIRGILPDLASRNVTEIRYFDARTNVIDDPPSVDGLAFQALKDATEAGQSVGGIAGAGVSLARDGATATSSTIPFVLPAGWAQGDRALVWLSTNSNPTVTAAPAGWVLDEGPVPNGTVQVAWRYSKILQAGEPNPTWTISQGVRPSGVMVVLRGIHATTPVHASAALAATASSTSHAAAAVTTTAAQAHLLTIWLTRWTDASGNGGVDYATPPGTHTTDGSVSVNAGANPGSGGLVAHLTANPVGPGTYGPYTATVPVAATGICGQLALLPATAGTGQVALVGIASAASAATGTLTVTRPPPTPPAGVVPAVNVQIAPGYGPMDPNPVFQDISAYVEPPIVIEGYGRSDELSEVTPTTMRLRLRNHDGRFTGGRPGGPYGTLRLGCRIRVTETYNGVAYQRFDGCVNGWPVDWPVGGGALAWADIDATDRSKRLGRPGDLRSMLEEEILRDSPTCYYPLSEQSGSVAAGSITSSPQGALSIVGFHAGGAVGGTTTLGGASGPGPDSLPAPSFDPAAATSGEYLRGKLVTAAGGGTGLTLEAWFRTSEATAGRTICSLQGLLGTEWRLLLNSLGRLQAFHYDPTTDRDARLYDVASPQSWNDDHDHHVALVESISGGVLTARVYVDGAQRAVGTHTVGGTVGRAARLLVGSDGDAGQLWAGTVSNIAVHSTALSATRVATHYHAGADGLTGERTDTRLHRIADWAGIPVSDRAFDVGDKTVGGQATAGKQPLEAMREVVGAEQGVLYVAGSGKLTFHRRGRRYNAAAAFTLDASQPGQVSLPASYPGDDFGVQNDVTVTRTGGGTQRAVNQAAIDGPDGVGLYRVPLEVAAATDADALAVGQWRVGNYGTPLPRLPALTVSLARLHDLGNTTLIGQLLAADISTVIHLQGLPTQAPATTDDQVIEGWTEVLGHGVWGIAFNTSPHSVNKVWILGTSALDTTARLAL